MLVYREKAGSLMDVQRGNDTMLPSMSIGLKLLARTATRYPHDRLEDYPT